MIIDLQKEVTKYNSHAWKRILYVPRELPSYDDSSSDSSSHDVYNDQDELTDLKVCLLVC